MSENKPVTMTIELQDQVSELYEAAAAISTLEKASRGDCTDSVLKMIRERIQAIAEHLDENEKK